LLTSLPTLPPSLIKLYCSGCTSLIFAPEEVIEQVGVELVEANYQTWRATQCRKWFGMREGIATEELIKVSCHPDRFEWYADWEELKWYNELPK
jgi:predicted DNA-binding protein (MmcQ/YjbR family)